MKSALGHPAELRHRLQNQSGQAMVLAMVTMLIVSLLAATAVTLAVSTNAGARQNTAQKQATEAAEAGLEVALYRYNTLAPSSTNCVGDAVVAPSANGTCVSSVTSVGSGATYQYYTTPVITSSTPCVGGTVSNGAGVGNICVTSVGTSHGVTVRSEMRAAAYQGGSLFPVSGIIGLTGVTVQNGSYTINAPLASNVAVTDTQSGTIYGTSYPVDLGPNGTPYPAQYQTAKMTVTRIPTIVLPPVNPGTSATTNANNTCTGTLTGTGCGLSTPSDGLAQYGYQPVVYNPLTRKLSTSGSAIVNLATGVYNLCSLETSGGTTINVSLGSKVVIYIDSPNDPTSNCPSGSGDLNISNGTTINNFTGDPAALQIFVYQQPSGTITWDPAGTSFFGTLYAPTSAVQLIAQANYFTFNGAIAASSVTLSGTSLNVATSASVSGIQGGTSQGTYYRTAWGRCTSSVSSTNPTAGCS